MKAVSIGIILFITTLATQTVQSKSVKYFLPRTTIPKHYDLDLDIFLGPQYYYNGSVDIYFDLLKESKNIVLHSRDLKIDFNKSYVAHKSGDRTRIHRGKFIKENQFLNLTLSKNIPVGSHALRLYFSGNYYDYANGLFLSRYNKDKYMLATHFEPIQARAMFPCFDEPDLKSTFRLRATHPKSFNAMSNTEVQQIKTSGNGRKTTLFKLTPKMSTYLLVLAVAEYDTLEYSYAGRKLHMYAPPESVNSTHFSLNISVQSLQQFERLLQVKYILPKMDGVVVHSFGGGMENYGLIVYGSSVIVHSKTKSEAYLEGTISLLCHEIAHQWFGNFVTLSWWDYVWLNEGFATYYAARNGDMIFENSTKNYRFMDNHVVGLQRVLKEDSTHRDGESLNKHVEKPETIRPKFNNIGYKKGSAIVRFMSLYFSGYDEGITYYLKEHALNNSSPNDLFRAINRYTDLPQGLTVEKIMTSWVENEGFPLITINTSYSNDVIKVSQERFSLTNTQSNETWYIPISFTQEQNPDFSLNRNWSWLSDQNRQFTFEIKKNVNAWLLGNLQAGMFCRINYDLENWKLIIRALKSPKYKEIHTLNRAQLINDANVLAKLGKIPERIALDLLSYLKHEHDPVVRKAAENIFAQYNALLKKSKSYNKFERFVQSVYDQEKSNSILNDQNLDDLIENALKNSVLENKFGQTSGGFEQLSQRIYTDETLNLVRSKVSTERNAASDLKLEFLENIEKTFEYNKIIKNKFIQNNNIDEVEKWLSQNY